MLLLALFIHDAMDAASSTPTTRFSMKVKSTLKEDADSEKEKATQEFCRKIDQIFDIAEYRMELIQSYQFMPPFITMCGYFGCKLHATPFFEKTDH